MSVKVKVLKSRFMPDTYVYLPEEAEPESLPEGLLQQFREAEEFLQFDLDEDRYLAQADPVKVLAALANDGYYVQLPPRDDATPELFEE